MTAEVFYSQQFTQKAGSGILYTDSSGTAWDFTISQKVAGTSDTTTSTTSDNTASFFVQADYTFLDSTLLYVNGTFHNVNFSAGSQWQKNQNNRSLCFGSFLGFVPDTLKLNFGKIKLLLNNLDYEWFSTNYCSQVTDNFAYSLKFFSGRLDSEADDLYIMIGDFNVPVYAGALINLQLPYDFGLNIFYTGADLLFNNEDSEQLGDGELSLFCINAGKNWTFNTQAEHNLFAELGFVYCDGSTIIKVTANSQKLVLYPFSFLGIDAGASLYFINAGTKYKMNYGGLTVSAGFDALINCYSVLTYYYKYVFKKNFVFDGTTHKAQDYITFSNFDSLLSGDINVSYKKSVLGFYLDKKFVVPVITEKTKKLFGKTNSDSGFLYEKDSRQLARTIFLSGLSLGIELEL